jgi:hypothetical protein
MDLLSRCEVELHNVGKIREQADALRSLVGSGPHGPRVAALCADLVALDRTLADRARQVLVRAREFAEADKGVEELELETELTAYLAQKLLYASALLKRELDPRRRTTVAKEEEPLA